MKNQPLIGLTPDFDGRPDDPPDASLKKDYTAAILAAGGLPVILPLTDDEAALNALLARLDGLALTGGGDVDPALYGVKVAARLRATLKRVSPVRDRMELFLTRRLLDEGRRPVLGICRGCQVMNVAAGGTLIVNLPRAVGATVAHSAPRPRQIAHEVALEPGSRLASLLGATVIGVNSSHHQAVDKVATKLRRVGCSPRDGVIEAVERDGRQFFVGVQWHPERLHTRHEHAAALFRALVSAAAAS